MARRGPEFVQDLGRPRQPTAEQANLDRLNLQFGRLEETLRGAIQDNSQFNGARIDDLRQLQKDIRAQQADRQQVERYTKAVKAIADGLGGNIRTFREGSDYEKAQAAMNIASAVCIAIPPPAGQVGSAIFALTGSVCGMFGGDDGNAMGKMLQSMINAAVREMKSYMDYKFEELHMRNMQEEMMWVEGNLAPLGPQFDALLEGSRPTPKAIDIYWDRLNPLLLHVRGKLFVVSNYLSTIRNFHTTKAFTPTPLARALGWFNESDFSGYFCGLRFPRLDVSKLTMFLTNYKGLVTALLSLLMQAQLKFAQVGEDERARSLSKDIVGLKDLLVHERLQQLEREIYQWLQDRLAPQERDVASLADTYPYCEWECMKEYKEEKAAIALAHTSLQEWLQNFDEPRQQGTEGLILRIADETTQGIQPVARSAKAVQAPKPVQARSRVVLLLVGLLCLWCVVQAKRGKPSHL